VHFGFGGKGGVAKLQWGMLLIHGFGFGEGSNVYIELVHYMYGCFQSTLAA